MRRRLEFAFYLSVAVGIALGTSSFMMLAGLFEVAEPAWILAAVLISGAICAVIALSIGELAGLFPSAPAIRTYFKLSFSDDTSIFFIYLYMVFIVLMAGVESYMFALVTRALFPSLPAMGVIVALLVVIVATNLLGLELPRGTQMLLALAAVGLLVVSGVAGVFDGSAEGFARFREGGFVDGLGGLPSAIGLGVFLFMGFEWVTPLGFRPRSYERLVPLSMPVSIGILLAAYLVFMVGMTVTLSPEQIAGTRTPQLPFFSALFGEAGRWAALALSLSAIASTFNAGLMGGSRLIMVLSREGKLPRWCGSVSLSTGAPLGAVLLLGGLAVASSMTIVSFRLELAAAVVAAAIICVIYAGYLIAAERLRRLEPARERPFKSTIPKPVRTAVTVLLLGIGAATVFSVPEEGMRPLAGLVAAVLVAVALTRLSARVAVDDERRPDAISEMSGSPVG